VTEYVIRFFVGGVVVSVFALMGDILRPKSFAGLLGAAPSVALVSLALANSSHGTSYVQTESAAMLAGAGALFIYSIIICQLLKRAKWSAIAASLCVLPVWLAVAFGLSGLVM
jgi:hypothetical protein